MGSYISGSPMPTQDEKTMALLAHMGTILANFVGLGFAVPLVLMLTKGKESSFVREHSVESLNFQINRLHRRGRQLHHHLRRHRRSSCCPSSASPRWSSPSSRA